jgi:hypothetical protein
MAGFGVVAVCMSFCHPHIPYDMSCCLNIHAILHIFKLFSVDGVARRGLIEAEAIKGKVVEKMQAWKQVAFHGLEMWHCELLPTHPAVILLTKNSDDNDIFKLGSNLLLANCFLVLTNEG